MAFINNGRNRRRKYELRKYSEYLYLSICRQFAITLPVNFNPGLAS